MSKLTQSGKLFLPLLIVMSNVSLASVDLSSSANFTTSFEATEGYTSGFLSSDPDWIIGNGSAPEVGSFAYTGQFGLNLNGFDSIRIDFSSLETPSVGWVDLYLKPAFGEADGLPVAFSLGQAALTGFVKVGLDGEVYVLDGNGSGDGVWLPTGYSVALNGNVSMDWLRMTYRLDYASQRWDLYLNDALQIVDLGFVDASAPPLSKFSLEGSLEGTTHFDTFTAGFINPLFADADNDGIDDAYETAQGMDPLTNDRDSDLDLDSVINVLEFMDGLEAGNPDTDGDGVYDGAEYAAGANPASADAYALESVPYIESFELYTEGDVTSQSFWQISGGNAVVQSAQSFDGAQVLELQVGQSTLELQNSFDGSDHSQVWVDLRVQPVHFQDRWLADINDYLSDEIASAFFFIENDQVAILDGDGQGSGAWSVLSDVVTDEGAWARVTIYQDYVSQEFKLWVNGVLLDGSYGFANTQPYFNRLSIKQDNTDSAYLDDVSVSAQRPLGLDSDGDGLTDDTEDANGNGLVDPGESDPLLADTDGDGFLDSDPVKLRLWLLADDGVLVDSNSLLTSWLDQSIYQDHASPEDSVKAPALVQGSVHFDGVDDFLSGTSSFDANEGDLTIVLVQRNFGTSDAAAFSYLNTELSSGSPLLTWSAADFFGVTSPAGDQDLLHDLTGATSELTITALRRSDGEINGLNSELNLRSSSDFKSNETIGTQNWESTVYQYSNDLVAIIQQGPSLNNGTIDGSLQVCLPDNFNFNGATINGDLLVAGSPEVRVNGNPNWDGLIEGSGELTADYQVTLNSNATLGALQTFSDAVQISVLEPVATPAGSRYVSLNSNSNDPGDFATIRNLTLNGNIGAMAIPAGVYGAFTANGNNSFLLGDPNSETPLVYEFERLTLNGNSALQVLGPVVIRVKNNISLNAAIGESSTVDYLTLELPTANLTLNSNSHFYGTVLAPEGKVTLNGNSTLTGRLIAEELSLNGGDLVAAGTWPSNPAPDLGYLIGKASPVAAGTYSGEILEIRVYDQALDDEVLDVIHTQLAQKYGISEDFDSDGITNFNDTDIDGDGLLNLEEDLNGNGIVDAGESDPQTADTDGDGVLDAYDLLWTADPVIDAATLQAQPDGSLMTRFSFDAADGYTTGSLGGQQGWEAAPVFRVSADDAADSTDQSLASRSVPYDSEAEILNAFAKARHYLDTSAAPTVWVSFQAKLQPAILADIDLSSNPAVVLALSFRNYVSVYDSSVGDWLKARYVVSPDTWVSYDLELDYTNKIWKLCIEGQTVFESIPFMDPTRSSLQQFALLQQSGIGQDGWIDEIEISNVEPAGLDFDGDGLDNATERQLGTDLNLADTDGDGINDLYESTNGLDPLMDDAGADLDGDGLFNYQEYALGFDPQVQDVEGADGIVRRDVWQDIIGESITVLSDDLNYPTNPDVQFLSLNLDIQDADSVGDDYGQRIYGLIVAPETAEYTFWIAGDDFAEFWLSTDATAFNKTRLCYLDVHSDYQEWDRTGTQQSVSIQLQAGQAYYFEILQKEIDGLSHVSVAWEYGMTPRTVITGEYLRVHIPDANDADLDGLPDDWETANGLDPTKGFGLDGYIGDPNFDGRSNYEEREMGTGPLNPNSDGDSFSNLVETKILGSDPLLAESNDYVVPEDFSLSSINGYVGEEAVAYASAADPSNLYFGGAGVGFQGTYDGGQFLNKEVSGDFAITMQLNRASDDGDFEIALVARESLSGGSAFVGLNSLSNVRHYRFYQRNGEAENLNTIKLNFSENPTGQRWLRLERNDNTFLAYASIDGVSWTFVGSHSLELPDQLFVGALLATGSSTNLRGVEITFTEWETDMDRDGLSDKVELSLGTALDVVDTDGDGFSDYEEVIHLGTDPLVANSIAVSEPLYALTGSASAASTGTWRSNEDGSIVSLDYRGSLSYDLDVQTPGIYRLDVAVREGNQYRDVSQFRLLAYIDGVYIGESLVTATPDEATTASFWLPWQGVGQPEVTFDWIPFESGTSLRIDSIEMVTLQFDDQATADAWQTAQLQDEFALPAAGTVLSTVSPYNLYGHVGNLDLVAIVRDADQQAFAPLRALSDTFHVDLPLSIEDVADAYTVQSHNGAFSESLSVEWQVTNLADTENLETAYLRPADRLLLGWSDEFGAKPEYGAYLEIFRAEASGELIESAGRTAYIDAMNASADLAGVELILAAGIETPWDFVTAERVIHQTGALVPFLSENRALRSSGAAPSDAVLLVDAYGLKGDEVSAVRFDQPGTYNIRATWRESDGFVYESLLEVIVVDVELGGTIASVVDYEREWFPTTLPELVELEADTFIFLTELESAAPREFGVQSSQPVNGSIIARLPGNGSVIDTVAFSSLVNYSTLYNDNLRVLNTFSDGTRLVEFHVAIGGDIPEDFSVNISVLTAGVLFDDGSVYKVVTLADLDELGRYRYRLLIPADADGSACHDQQAMQAGFGIDLRN